jgi:hypothetical protein
MCYRYNQSSTWFEQCYGVFSLGYAHGELDSATGRKKLWVATTVNGAYLQAIGIDANGGRVSSCRQIDTTADGTSNGSSTDQDACGAAVQFAVADVGIPIFSLFF